MSNISSSAQASAPKFTDKKYLITLIFVTSLFMFWGIAITMGDVLNKHFQHVLSLTKTQSAFVQFAIFGAYGVMGIPAGLFMKRFGYKNGVLFGLTLFAIGSFLFAEARCLFWAAVFPRLKQSLTLS
jgi:FHS family L-fucose permease-like MFS transporter